jgi:hypothetical protein
MKDIKTKVYSMITDDTTFKTLTGASATDKRLYQQYPPDQVDKTNPWVTYFTIAGALFGPDQIGDIQVPDIIFTFDIWGDDVDDVDDVFDQLMVLLNRQVYTDSTAHTIFYIGLDGFNDLVEVEPDEILYHKNVRFRFKDIVEI